jgi:glutamate--cysteine ligase
MAADDVDRAPTLDDLTYHVTTLFPPVRPRGAVEIRYLDAQRGEGWLIPLAVVYALVYDDVATDRARAAAEPIRNAWAEGARHGLADQAMRTAAVDTLVTALECMSRHDEPGWIIERVASFLEQYTKRGRCPADDVRLAGPGNRPAANALFDEPIPAPAGAMP